MMYAVVYMHVCLYAGRDDEPESSAPKKAKTEEEEEEAGINHILSVLVVFSSYIIQDTVTLCTNSLEFFIRITRSCVNSQERTQGTKVCCL